MTSESFARSKPFSRKSCSAASRIARRRLSRRYSDRPAACARLCRSRALARVALSGRLTGLTIDRQRGRKPWASWDTSLAAELSLPGEAVGRSEEGRVGKELVGTCRSLG